MRLLARCALVGEAKALARDTCNNINLSGGLQLGIEGNLHAIRTIWPESAGWAFDPGTTAEPQNIFQQLLDGAERELAQAEDTPPVSQNDNLHLSQEEVKECRYQPNVGFGVELVDEIMYSRKSIGT